MIPLCGPGLGGVARTLTTRDWPAQEIIAKVESLRAMGSEMEGHEEEVSTVDAIMLRVAEIIQLIRGGSLQQETFDYSKRRAVRDAYSSHRPSHGDGTKE